MDQCGWAALRSLLDPPPENPLFSGFFFVLKLETVPSHRRQGAAHYPCCAASRTKGAVPPPRWRAPSRRAARCSRSSALRWSPRYRDGGKSFLSPPLASAAIGQEFSHLAETQHGAPTPFSLIAASRRLLRCGAVSTDPHPLRRSRAFPGLGNGDGDRPDRR